MRTRTKWIWSGLIAAFLALVVILIVTAGQGRNDASLRSGPTSVRRDSTIDAPQEPASLGTSLGEQCVEFTGGMSAPLSAAGDSLSAIGGLATDAASDPSLVFDAGWKTDVQTAYQGLRDARDRVVSLSAPTAGLEEIRSVVLQGFEELLASEAPLLQGAEELDVALIGQAAALMTTGGAPWTERPHL